GIDCWADGSSRRISQRCKRTRLDESSRNWARGINRWNKNDARQLSTQTVTNHGGQMPDKKQDLIDQNLQDLNNDGVDRRGFLKCMAWAGTGLVWTMAGGIPVSRAFAKGYGKKDPGKGADFTFVQISDS